MDNLQKIEHRQTKFHLLFIFRLTCSKFFALKRNALTPSFQNHFSNHTITPIRVLIMGRSGCATKGGSWGDFLQAQKIELSPSVGNCPQSKIDTHRVSWPQTTYREKMVSLIVFRQNLPRTLPAACIFSYTIMTYLKNFDGTKSLNAKQYPAVLTTWIILQVSPFLSPLLWCCFAAPTRFELPHSTFLKNPGDGKKSYPRAKNLPISSTRKIPPNRFTSSTINSAIPSPSNSNFHVITLCTFHLYL